jgi:Mrp family chromosome partitioning ATPase
MSIVEHALDKARGDRQSPARSALRRRNDVASVEEQRETRTPASHPQYRQLSYAREACETNRIFLPGTTVSEIGGADAAYRMLRTRVLQRVRTNKWSTLAITSSGPLEGKSLTTLNLALSIARDSNNQVFLIDLDMRHPSLCQNLGVEPEFEILNFFRGQVAPQDTLFSIGLPNLAIAGSRNATEQASELLASTRLEELLAYIKGVSPEALTLIDMPPLLVTDEFLVIAPRVDATLLVVSEEVTKRESVSRALQLLADFKLAGIVLNRTREVLGSYYYGSATD